MGPHEPVAHGDLVAFRDQVVDLAAQVWECGQKVGRARLPSIAGW
jgi:hypothetical protein